MRVISDLTKDIRQPLEEILIESIQDTVELDKNKDNNCGELIAYENYTFYYRVIYLFMQRAVLYYNNKEIEDWIKRELLKETVLPKIEDFI